MISQLASTLEGENMGGNLVSLSFSVSVSFLFSFKDYLKMCRESLGRNINLSTTQEVYLTEMIETAVAKWGSSGSSSGFASCCFQAAKEGRQSGAGNGEPCSGLPQWRVALNRVRKPAWKRAQVLVNLLGKA